MMTTFLFSGLLTLAPAQAPAQTQTQAQAEPPAVQCPFIPVEYEQMIAKLDAVKTSIRKDANCTDITLKVKTLEDLVASDREAVMKIVESAGTAPLSGEQTEIIRKYAEEVTKKVAAINDLLSSSNHCFREDSKATPGALSSLVSEAASLLGSLAGPWGTPISIAGSVVAGLLGGMDNVSKTRSGYDFTKRDDWVSYVQNLCTFHVYREDVEKLLEPERYLEQLIAIRHTLNEQIARLNGICRECHEIQLGYETHPTMAPQDLMTALNSEIQAANKTSTQPLGTFMLQSLGQRDWILKEIARIQNEIEGKWASVSGRYVLGESLTDLKRFLIDRQAPRFLNWQIGESQTAFTYLDAFVSYEGTKLYRTLLKAQAIRDSTGKDGWNPPKEIYKALVGEPIMWSKLPTAQAAGLKDEWQTFQIEAHRRLRRARMALDVARTFCEFFDLSRNTTGAIRAQCKSPQMLELVEYSDSLPTQTKLARTEIKVSPHSIRLLSNEVMKRTLQ